MVICDSGDGPGIPTASLGDIVRGSRSISGATIIEDARERENLALYLRAFELNPEQLTREHQWGVYALRRIRNSGTYRGFVDFLNDKDGVCPSEVNPLDYKIGVERAVRFYQEHEGRRPEVVIV